MLYDTRAATHSDFDWLYALRRKSYLEVVTRQFGAWDEQRQLRLYRDSLKLDDTRVLIVEGAPAGMFSVERQDDCLWLAEIQIEPTVQGRGIGSAVIRDLELRAQALEVPLRLRVLHENLRARALYETLGFRHIETTEHHHVMERASQFPAAEPL